MNKNDIIDYVMHTPRNTNKAVLNSMLNELIEDSGGDNNNMVRIEIVNIGSGVQSLLDVASGEYLTMAMFQEYLAADASFIFQYKASTGGNYTYAEQYCTFTMSNSGSRIITIGNMGFQANNDDSQFYYAA